MFKVTKFLIVLFLIGFCLTSCLSAKKQSANSFDKIKFGMSKAKIINIFKSEVNFFNLWKVKSKLFQKNRAEDKLIGSYRLMSSNLHFSKGITTDLKFTFIENKLFEIMINFKIKNGSKQTVSNLTKRFLTYYKAKYGKPYYEEDFLGDTYSWKKGVNSVRMELMSVAKNSSTIDIICLDNKLLGKYMKKYAQWKSRKK
ncbi:hypothetical protein KAJ27_19930 [bacterium]|nr:hypothetical protein [bacterium]